MRRREATKQSVIALVIVPRSHVKPKLCDVGECMSVSNEALIGEAAHLLRDQIVVDMVMHASTSLWSEPRDFGYAIILLHLQRRGTFGGTFACFSFLSLSRAKRNSHHFPHLEANLDDCMKRRRGAGKRSKLDIFVLLSLLPPCVMNCKSRKENSLTQREIAQCIVQDGERMREGGKGRKKSRLQSLIWDE